MSGDKELCCINLFFSACTKLFEIAFAVYILRPHGLFSYSSALPLKVYSEYLCCIEAWNFEYKTIISVQIHRELRFVSLSFANSAVVNVVNNCVAHFAWHCSKQQI